MPQPHEVFENLALFNLPKPKGHQLDQEQYGEYDVLSEIEAADYLSQIAYAFHKNPAPLSDERASLLEIQRHLILAAILDCPWAQHDWYTSSCGPRGFTRTFVRDGGRMQLSRDDYGRERSIMLDWSLPHPITGAFTRVQVYDRYGNPQSGFTGGIATYMDIPYAPGDNPDHFTLTMQLFGDPFGDGAQYDYRTFGGQFAPDRRLLVPAETYSS